MTINSLNFSTNTMQYDKEIINFKQKANEKHQAKFMDLSGLPNLGYAKNGETTILGKLWGYDKNISKKEVEDLKKFIEVDHKIGGFDFGGKGLFMLYESEFNSLFNSTMSINEFKEKYLETKKRYELRHGYQTHNIVSINIRA
ncbi:hypothetical protein [Campylobacter helveticus]|uniref:hypothetical protein n=1 Tax=Campylobacter helveticus TaxID=28898 RepID=UPI00214CDC63|nr:hypothetical protein [Campylobacter helveticus]MCR2060527.1 hypothetical protein [Campylobacter helveticus]